MRAVKKRGRGRGGGDFGDRVKNKRTQYVYALSIDVEPLPCFVIDETLC